jgi:GMP synthase-like glutamine amidotransferase
MYIKHMKILLVDNGTRYLPQLQSLLSPAKITVVPFQKLTKHDIDNYDLIILSGGHKYTVISHRLVYSKELNLIINSRKPIIGICLGFELIVTAFGGRLKLLRKSIHHDVKITFLQQDPISTRGRATYTVFENHRRGVKSLPKTLIPLARSSSGVEIIKHADRPIYAFQFHPEVGAAGSGELLIKNAIHYLMRSHGRQ